MTKSIVWQEECTRERVLEQDFGHHICRWMRINGYPPVQLEMEQSTLDNGLIRLKATIKLMEDGDG